MTNRQCAFTLWNIIPYSIVNAHLVNYLQHFIACYKNTPLVYHCLKECRDVFSGKMYNLISDSIKKIESGKSIYDSISLITSSYPHFILVNLHTLINSIELYGANEYLASFDLLLQDTDDLIADVSLFKLRQQKMKTRMYLLIGMSLLLSYFVKFMINQINLNVNTVLYQYACIFFIMVVIITFMFAQRVDKQRWLLDKELIC